MRDLDDMADDYFERLRDEAEQKAREEDARNGIVQLWLAEPQTDLF